MARQPLNKVIHPGRAASIIARAGSQLHGATVAAREARLQTLTPGDQKEAGVLGKVEQTEDEVEGEGGGISFLFLPPTTPLFFLPLASPLFRLPRPPRLALLHESLSFSLFLPIPPLFYPRSLFSRSTSTDNRIRGSRAVRSQVSPVDGVVQFSRHNGTFVIRPSLNRYAVIFHGSTSDSSWHRRHSAIPVFGNSSRFIRHVNDSYESAGSCRAGGNRSAG